MNTDASNWPMWIVVAGGKSAVIYLQEKYQAPLQHQQTIHYADSSLKEQDRVTDQPGRSFDRHGLGRHRLEPKTTKKRHDETLFAAEVVAAIQQGYGSREFSSVALLAPPRLLGELRAEIKPPLHAAIACEISKDLSEAGAEDIRERVNNRLSNRRAVNH